ncbi:MAG: 3-dehydroquinate synthase II [Candidatus Thermoplasmatota archaeon]|nr:3-dehydroquinate synthase II [Candidatus Thermoplasmatota archaeon]
MEIWLNCINLVPKHFSEKIDKILSKKEIDAPIEEIIIKDDFKLEQNGKSIGKIVNISNKKEQEDALSLIGSVSWILIKCDDWKMIPCENLIAAAESSGTKLAAIVENKLEIPAIAFALEIGVDALVVTEELLDAAIITKLQRLEIKDDDFATKEDFSTITQESGKIIGVESQGVGDRVCIDTISFLEKGEGMLCGSFAKSLALVHAETLESEFVPTRPFRVNAGGIHSYIMMGDLSTCYLSELKSGDEVLIVNAKGNSRVATIGRIKLEKRPLIKIKWVTNEGFEGDIILQQAETVRLIRKNSQPISVTKIDNNIEIIIHNSIQSRHIGAPIRAFSQEY